jgi:hypothetical protein
MNLFMLLRDSGGWEVDIPEAMPVFPPQLVTSGIRLVAGGDDTAPLPPHAALLFDVLKGNPQFGRVEVARNSAAPQGSLVIMIGPKF